jgi:hypothetical protein
MFFIAQRLPIAHSKSEVSNATQAGAVRLEPVKLDIMIASLLRLERMQIYVCNDAPSTNLAHYAELAQSAPFVA